MATKKQATGTKKATKFPLHRDEFQQKAKPIMVTIHLPNGRTTDITMAVKRPKEGEDFSADGKSEGWTANQKITILVGDVPVECQLGFNLTAIGSKEA